MLSLRTQHTKIQKSLKVAYINNFALEMNATNMNQSSAKAKSDSKRETSENDKWKKNLKRIEITRKKDKKERQECMYEQSSMFLFAIPK